MKHAYFVVEGPHDVEFVGRLLKPYRFERVNLVSRLDPYWRPLIPDKFPHGGDLSRRVPVPTFFVSADASVAVHAAGGDSQVHLRVEETLATPLPVPLDAVGVLLDADSQDSPGARFEAVRKGLAGIGLTVPAQPGVVSTTAPRCGVYVLPDNQTAGTLEDLLLECADVHYPGLLADARALVGRVLPAAATTFTPEDMKDFKKPAGPKKATVACIAGVLKPGKAVQVSIQDNRWLEGAALQLPRIGAVQQFIRELLNLP